MNLQEFFFHDFMYWNKGQLTTENSCVMTLEDPMWKV